MKTKRLQIFLYLLMRDALPVGEVVMLYKEALTWGDADPSFTIEQLGDYAEGLVQSLTQ